MNARWPWLLLGLAFALGFAALGSWQLERAREKEALLARVEIALSRQVSAPLAAAAVAGGIDWAEGAGQFLPRPMLLLDNQRREQAVGVRMLAVFQPAAGSALLVDMGWLALPGNRKLPVATAPGGERILTGLLVPPPSPGIALGPAYVERPEGWLLTRVDIPALSAALGLPLAPRMLRLDPALKLGYMRDLDVLPNTLPPARHRGYAVQWFGLSLAAVVLTLILFVRRKKP